MCGEGHVMDDEAIIMHVKVLDFFGRGTLSGTPEAVAVEAWCIRRLPHCSSSRLPDLNLRPPIIHTLTARSQPCACAKPASCNAHTSFA
eukprot:118837-Chlamydomonas_euryale.AAC.8